MGRGLRILVSGSGGLGLRQGDGVHLLRSGLCRAMGTLGAAQTRQGTSGSLDSPFAAASSGETGCEPKNAGAAPRPSRGCAVSSYLPFPRNAPQQSSRDHRGEDCVNLERQQLGAGSACRSGARRDHRAAAPSHTAASPIETHPRRQAATMAAQPSPPKRGSDWVQAQPASQAQGATTAPLRRHIPLCPQ